MKAVRENIKKLMERLDYPWEATQALLRDFDRMTSDKMGAVWLSRLIARYDAGEMCEYEQMLKDIQELGRVTGVHEYSAGMLLYLCLGERLRLRYAERGIDESIFYNSMADLRYKLEECRLIHGRVGTFVAFWYPGFFRMTRFALRRLQFEIVTMKESCEVAGISLPENSKVINIHIPRTGTKLDHEEVLESYRMAAEMFADAFGDRPIVFHCQSWLLDPWHETVLSPGSNMLAFYHDFKIVKSGNYDNNNGLWRVFDKAYNEDIDAMPGDTSLRRAYIERVRQGQSTGWGKGVFIWRDGKVCR